MLHWGGWKAKKHCEFARGQINICVLLPPILYWNPNAQAMLSGGGVWGSGMIRSWEGPSEWDQCPCERSKRAAFPPLPREDMDKRCHSGTRKCVCMRLQIYRWFDLGFAAFRTKRNTFLLLWAPETMVLCCSRWNRLWQHWCVANKSWIGTWRQVSVSRVGTRCSS